MSASTELAPARPVRSSSFFRGAWRVFELSLGEMLWSRRTVFLAIVVGCPVLVAAVIRIVDSMGIAPLRLNGQRMDATVIFGMMIWLLFLRFIVPVLGVFYGTSLIADEVEDKTITYLFTRPIRRSAVLVGKYIAYLVCTTLVVLPGVMLVYFLIIPFQQVGASFTMLVTLMYYIQSLVPHAMPAEGVTSLLQAFFTDVPSTVTCLGTLAAAIAISLTLAGKAVERREYVLDQ